MREIKFRGMNFCGKWVYGDLRHDRMCMPDGKLQEYISVCGEPVLPESVGQFTGLKDLTGKKIYEGDIVTVEGWRKPTFVEWFDANAQFVIDGSLNLGLRNSFMSVIGNVMRVIGNVHDNPELLS